MKVIYEERAKPKNANQTEIQIHSKPGLGIRLIVSVIILIFASVIRIHMPQSFEKIYDGLTNSVEL